jgi:hypothetical protein
MMKTTRTALVLALTVSALSVSAMPAKAASILYYSDFTVGTDRMAAALLALAGSHTTTTAASTADFATQIATGNYDLGIFFQQSSSGAGFNTAWTALSNFVDAGGRAIVADWTVPMGLSNSPAEMGFSYAGDANETEVTVTDASLATGIANPVALANPGWGIFSYGLNGTCAAVFGNGDCAVVSGAGGRVWLNGFLGDTFANGAQGQQLYTNEINTLLNPSVPEPATLALFGTGLLFASRRRRTTK